MRQQRLLAGRSRRMVLSLCDLALPLAAQQAPNTGRPKAIRAGKERSGLGVPSTCCIVTNRNHNSDPGVVCPGITGGIAFADAVPDTLDYEVAAIFAGEVSRAMTRTKHATISGTASRAVRDTTKEKGRDRKSVV